MTAVDRVTFALALVSFTLNGVIAYERGSTGLWIACVVMALITLYAVCQE